MVGVGQREKLGRGPNSVTMRRSYQITGTVLLLLAVFIAVESLKLRYYTSMGPGPGFFPLWLSLLLGTLAITILFQATLGQPEPMPSDFFGSRTGYLRMGAIVLALVGTTALIELLGFCLTMLAMYLFLLYMFGQRGMIITALVALAGSFGVYYLFVRWLQVPLPIGVLGF
jgi:putative tricarboxylic transport membrane protein